MLLLLAAIGLVSYDYIRTRDAYPPGTFIAGIDVSFLTEQQAIRKLKAYPLSQLYTPVLTLESDNKKFTFSPEQLGVHVLYAETADKAFTLSHRGSYADNLLFRVQNGEIHSPLIIDVNDNVLRAVLKALADDIRSTPKDATMAFYEKSGGYNIASDDPGRELNLNRSVVRFKVRMYKGEKTIPLVVDYTLPKITEKALRAYPPVDLLAAYTTYYGMHDDPSRIHNIKLVASWVDGTLMMPGDILSVAEILGDVTEEQGFKEALVIIKNELVPQLGGGSCQVATTLFNAASLADLKIHQRRNHSFYFNIYPLGRDAAVYPGHIDFEFENDSGYPILLKAKATNKKLSFKILGTPSGKKVKFSQLKIFGKDDKDNYVPMSLKKVIDEDRPFRTEIIRTVWDKLGKKLAEDKVISKYKMYGDKENVPIRRPEEG